MKSVNCPVCSKMHSVQYNKENCLGCGHPFSVSAWTEDMNKRQLAIEKERQQRELKYAKEREQRENERKQRELEDAKKRQSWNDHVDYGAKGCCY